MSEELEATEDVLPIEQILGLRNGSIVHYGTDDRTGETLMIVAVDGGDALVETVGRGVNRRIRLTDFHKGSSTGWWVP